MSDGKTLTVWTDGKSDGQIPMPGVPADAVKPLWGNVLVGGGLNTTPLDGWVDELEFYGRALGAEEIRRVNEAPLKAGCLGR